MFAFDQWHLLVTSMEIARLVGVDLVVAHVVSVDERVYQLMKHYEKDGLLDTRPAIKFPTSISELAYNPNGETTWNNQIVNSHHCLYEFRESAEFILFNDWDELIVKVNSQPLPSIFRELVERNRDTAALNYVRHAGYTKGLGR